MKTRECYEAEKLIIGDLDEGLTPSEQVRLEHHLSLCEPCRQVREETRALLSSIASDLPEEPGEEFWTFYHQSLDARLKERASRPAWGFWWKAAGVFVAAVIVLVMIRVAVFQPHNRQIADRRVVSSDLVHELEQVYGPTSEELPGGSLYGDQFLTVANARAATHLDDSDVQWFEVEDEAGPLYL
jgi:Putative zinc-finger